MRLGAGHGCSSVLVEPCARGRARDRDNGAVTRDQLREHLLRTRIAGDVATPREVNLRHYRRFALRDPAYLLGLDPAPEWDEAAVLALLAERAGVSPDPGRAEGPDTIDPELTLAALDRFADELAAAAARRGSVLVGTGHPATLLGFHAAVAGALAAAGCAVRTPAHHHRFTLHDRDGAHPCALDYIRSVGTVRMYEESGTGGPEGSGGPALRPMPSPTHTHSPQPVRIALAALAAAGEPPPDLVIGDHGWMCGAGRLGVRTIGFADSNDPAPFVAEAIGEAAVTVPLDDGVRAEYYAPLIAHVLHRAGLSR